MRNPERLSQLRLSELVFDPCETDCHTKFLVDVVVCACHVLLLSPGRFAGAFCLLEPQAQGAFGPRLGPRAVRLPGTQQRRATPPMEALAARHFHCDW